MSTFTLPTLTDSAHYEYALELDGETFTLSFNWNSREEAWYLSVADSLGTVLVAGKKIVVGYPLFARTVNDALPKGYLEAIDTSGLDLAPGYADLGGRVKLVYTDEAEKLEALSD